MGKRSIGRDQTARRIVALAARLAVDEKRVDLTYLRRKAAKQLGCEDPRCWPDLATIERAVRDEQLLFRGQEQAAALAQLRRQAVTVMQLFRGFQPRLTGAVLDGTADEHSVIRLILTADEPEAVVRELLDKQVAWRAGEIKLRWARGRYAPRPCLKLTIDGTEIEAILLNSSDRNHPPFEEDGRSPMLTASVSEVHALSLSGERRATTAPGISRD